jgi:Ca2+-binding EF-hand superfamily protein
MKNGMILCMALAAAAAAGAWAQAEAATAGGQVAQILRQADANGDGKVTYEELKAVRPQVTEERFKAADKNGDGVLSREDRADTDATAGGAGMLAKLKEADTNGDRKLSREEAQAAFPQAAEKLFDKADRDGDGFVTPEEIQQGLGEKLRQADGNGDGKLSPEEAKAAFPRMNDRIFQRLDRNKDGFLSKEDRNRQG